MRLAVTGASGFVGGAVARDAVRQGHEVHVFSRRDPRIAGARFRPWDLTDGALADPPDVDTVVHAGATVSDWCTEQVAHAVNVAGTRAVRETFPGARLVHVSSGSVYDPYRPTVRGREVDAPVGRYLNAYGRSKAAAERYLQEDARRADHGRGPIVVLRPHAVYGPGDTTLLPRIEGAVRGRNLVIVGDGRVLQHLTHVDTLVRAVRAATTVDVPPGEALVANVADAEPVVLRDVLVDLLDRRGHGQVRVVGIPARPGRVLAGALEVVARAARRTSAPRLTRYAISHLASERTYDLRVLHDVLGVEPRATSTEGAEGW
ncbi:NAD-dependent epimerase/dehydratase family protein [Oerskovia flava]|uniref:NAD-dependent epimerase/dehydratase family protein n=1 Tax=Oerskovia flava TaxID=2986422 RepID=UPI00223FCE16|nr:NAD(P)-dependent oxidoreductase [Oerskovia sp. JB1-3-2]